MPASTSLFDRKELKEVKQHDRETQVVRSEVSVPDSAYVHWLRRWDTEYWNSGGCRFETVP